jgi:hypothetical protein
MPPKHGVATTMDGRDMDGWNIDGWNIDGWNIDGWNIDAGVKPNLLSLIR